MGVERARTQTQLKTTQATRHNPWNPDYPYSPREINNGKVRRSVLHEIQQELVAFFWLLCFSAPPWLFMLRPHLMPGALGAGNAYVSRAIMTTPLLIFPKLSGLIRIS